ncbi:MAG: YggT family protein [Alphaproteobacteria bacterium]
MSFITGILLWLIQLLIYAFVGRAIISWLFMAGVRNEFVLRLNQALGTLTEPLIAPLRRVIPPLGMFDITPLVAIIGLIALRAIIRSL